MNILVTGGSTGLGQEIVKKLSIDPRNKIFFTYNNHNKEAEALSIQTNAIAIKCDFTNIQDVNSLVDSIASSELDVLVNNAYVGSPQGTHFHKTYYDIFQKSFENNIIPTIKITQSVINVFKKKKFGKIINILTAALANTPPIGYSVYAANKAYLLQLSKSWNSEYRKFNITSNCISPDFMLTNMSNSVDERIVEQLQNEHPLKQLLTPEEVAESVIYIVNASQQINGINLLINASQNIL